MKQPYPAPYTRPHPFSVATLTMIWLYAITITFSFITPTNGETPPTLPIGHFSQATVEQSTPEGWEPMHFDKIKAHTQYRLIKEGGEIVVKATSNASSSGLIRRTSIDPQKYPFIQWRWKVENIIPSGDVSKKSGDDYPARIYITFEYDGSKLGFFEKAKFNAAKMLYGEYPPLGAINYIWANKAPQGSAIPNAYVSRVIMVVVESGASKTGTWRSEKRNIYEDYKQVFGHEPPMISGIAIMTDTDNTQTSAVAYYGDIRFTSE